MGEGEVMKEKVKKLCLDCNHRCEDMVKCDFRPRKDLLSIIKQHIHLESPAYINKKKNTELCVVCKNAVQEYKWAKLEHGYYSFCLKCHERHLLIAKNVSEVVNA